jgi:predicted DNA-binding transcriptional regulator AlpA
MTDLPFHKTAALAGPPGELIAKPDSPPVTLGGTLRELAALLPGLRAALERNAKPTVDRFTLRFGELEAALGVSRRLLERELSAGRFPQPDVHIGRVPLWRPSTIDRWLDSQKGGSS